MSEGWRELRVFISSTFRDMQAERDHLVRFVFPRLREQLLSRRLQLVDVDLRWGVTADQDAFDLCMREIDLCRPRFIAILGGRYGWVPPPRTLPPEFLEALFAGTSPAGTLTGIERDAIDRIYESGQVPRLRDKPRSVDDVSRFNVDANVAVSAFQRAGLPEASASITASEVLHGALDDLDQPLFRFFYFRESAVTDSIPEPYAKDYREPHGSFANAALDSLKHRVIREMGVVPVAPAVTEMRALPAFTYPARWDDRTHRITSLEEFGDRVEADLLASVDAEMGPMLEPLTGFAAEKAAMEAFIDSRTQRYVIGTRARAFEELEEHTSDERSDTRLMVLVGEPGSGNSAMLARFSREHERAHPEHLLVTHFIGASAASTNARQMLRRLWHELVQGAGLEQNALAVIPDEWDKLREGLPAVLAAASQSHRTVIVIDAVNQLDPAHDAHSIRWLPEDLPANVRVVLSVLPGEAFDALQKRRLQPRFSPIGRLTENDAGEIMGGFLERYRKSLDARQKQALLSKKEAGNPLYLLTALEELRTLGTYEEITARIDDLPDETQPLFAWILRRLEGDDGFRDVHGDLNGSRIVRSFCSSVAVSRAGMAEWELAELAGDSSGNTAALARLLRPYLMYRGELLDFFHGQIREAAASLYLDDETKRLAAHRSVADLFGSRADPGGDGTWAGAPGYPRGVSELPFHLTESRTWDKLSATLTDLGFLEAKCTYVAVAEVGEGDSRRKVHGGVYELQDDYRRALDAGDLLFGASP